MHVLIIGAGIMGLSTARSCLKRGHAVTVFEQGSVPNATGSSVDAHRLIRHPYGAQAGYAAMIDPAFAAWDALWADLGTRLYYETGTLVLGRAGESWARESADVLDGQGRAVHWLRMNEVRHRFPVVRTGDLDHAFYLPTGGALYADRIVQALAVWIQHHGGTLHAHTTVRTLDAERARVGLADGTAVAGDVLVVAAGPWTKRLAGPDCAPVTPSRQVVVYAQAPPDHRRFWERAPMILDIDPEIGFYLVPPVPGTTLKFGDHTFSMHGDPDADRTVPNEAAERVYHKAAGRFEDFDRYQQLHAKACFYTVAERERIQITPLSTRSWVMTGFSGHGFKFGALMGERMAEAIDGALDAEALTAWAAGDVVPEAIPD